MEGAEPAGRVIGKRSKTAPAQAPAALPEIVIPPAAEASGGTAPDEGGELALVLLPAGEPTNAQCEAFAAALGVLPYDARMKLREPLPQVLVGSAAEMGPVARTLQAAGIAVVVVDARPLTSPHLPFRVQRVAVEGDAVRLGGPRGEVVVDLRQPALLVAGRYDFKATAGFGSNRAEAAHTEMFGHLYAGGWTDPLELVETDVKDWEFLGAARSPVRRANFQKTLELLRRWPSVAWNDALLQHPGRVKESAHGLAGSGRFSGPSDMSERSNEGGADLLSRVFYQVWRSGLDAGRVAAHDAGMTVVTLTDAAQAAEKRVAAAFGGGPTALDLAHENVRQAAQAAAAPPRRASGRASRTAGLIPPPDPSGAAAVEPPLRPASGRLGHASSSLAGDPTRPLRPNPPGAPAVTLLLRGLSLQAPHACVCCLGPPGLRALEAEASETDWENVASTSVGLLALFMFDRGWVHTSHEESFVVRLPACAECYRHETTNELSWIISGAVCAAGVVATLAATGLPSVGTGVMIAVGWAVALVVLALLVSMVLARHGPRCAPHAPLRLATRGGEFKLVLGNHSYGERLAELNPELVVRRL